MKSIILASILLCFSYSSFGLLIVSDLDDTLKITNVSDFSDATRNALFSKKAFLNFPALLNSMHQYSNGLYVLSGSPSFLRGRVDSFLDHHGISRSDVILKKIFRDRSSYEYKLNELKRLFRENPDEKFILIGDDTEYDPKVYAAIKEMFPSRVEQIYIRAVKNTALPKFIKKFFTAFEIAINEYINERMDLNQALFLGKSFLLTRDFELIIPPFAYCPKNSSDFETVPVVALEFLHKQIKNRITKYCLQK